MLFLGRGLVWLCNMLEIFESLSQWFKEKTTSPLYGTYIFAIIFWNWRFFYTLFFQAQTSLSIPKIEYVEQKFLSDGLVQHFLWFLIPPLVITYIIIWWLPIVANLVHKRHLRFYFYRKSTYDEEKLVYEERRKQILNQLVGIKEQQIESTKKIQKSLTNEERWEEEYNEFTKSNIFQRFEQIIEAVYKNSGYLPNSNVDSNMIAGADVRGLTTFQDSSRTQIDLTEKGKFFAKKYLDHPPTPDIEDIPF